ncbi:hypothetical protein NL676_017423 [Syzygium grande]|nr:hypothetical protein NL676_017423 [Syzygium grande]
MRRRERLNCVSIVDGGCGDDRWEEEARDSLQDKYEYLEKTVGNQDDQENSSYSKKSKDGSSEESYKKRVVDKDVEVEDRKSKKFINGKEENGSKRDRKCRRRR